MSRLLIILSVALLAAVMVVGRRRISSGRRIRGPGLHRGHVERVWNRQGDAIWALLIPGQERSIHSGPAQGPCAWETSLSPVT